MDDRPEEESVGSLYRLDADHRCTRMASGVKVSNGLAWSPDGRTLYHSDSRGPVVYRYDYDPETGSIGERRIFVDIQPGWGRPDGGAMDVDGCYWSCGVSSGRINRPVGGTDRIRRTAGHAPHHAVFAGPDLKTLYITSLRQGLSADNLTRTPLAGGLFRIAGTPTALYKG